MSEPPRRFSPLHRASREQRATLLFLVGPLLWLVSLVVLSVAVERADAVGIGLLFAGLSFIVTLAVLVPMRMRRVRDEDDAA
jgi:hypothetical protein